MIRKTLSLVVSVMLLAGVAGCTGSSSNIKPAKELTRPTEDKALVRFMKLGGMVGPFHRFKVLDGKTVIGDMGGKMQFDYLADPGEHLFIAMSNDNEVFAEANLEAGKTYYIILAPYSIYTGIRIKIHPVTRGSKYWDKVLTWQNQLKTIPQDKEKLEKWQKVYEGRIGLSINDYDVIWKDKYDWVHLTPEDGR